MKEKGRQTKRYRDTEIHKHKASGKKRETRQRHTREKER